MSLDESECLGCVYIVPPKSQEVDAEVPLRVRQSEFKRGLDPVLFETVRSCIVEVCLSRRPGFPARIIGLMREIIVAEHISLDGVVQAPGGREEDTSGGFQFGGWSVPLSSKEGGKVILSLHEQPFELLLGRNTYDGWADYWPKQPRGNPIADPFNDTIKHVATHRPDSLTWHESRAVDIDGIRELKETEGRDLLTWGSSDLVRQMLAEGLVDTLWLFVYPVVLGAGKRLWDGSAMPSSFRVVNSETTPAGMQALCLERDGEVRTGNI